MSELIFTRSRSGRIAKSQWIETQNKALATIPASMLRENKPSLAEMSELEVVRHYTRLSQLNFAIDTNFYPLGSCTMKYNPRVAHFLASLPGFSKRHPYHSVAKSQGFLSCLYELQEVLKELTGMAACSLSPMAGAQGEFVGLAMIKAYHQSNGAWYRNEIIVPNAAHGTNSASAAMCGFKVVEVTADVEGNVDLSLLKNKVSQHTAGMMLTNPSTFGIFEKQINQLAEIIHQAGGLLYYDGANFNSILGRARPHDMGFDVMHLNLHKTFATPHGGGGPGSGPVLAGAKLAPFLPIPIVEKKNDRYYWAEIEERSQSIGRMSAFMGNVGVLLRAYVYIKMLGREGMPRVADYAVLNANYLMHKLQQVGFTLAFPKRQAAHEFLITLQPLKQQYNITALDFAKRILDYGCYAPTIYFPLVVPECMLIEPTETESKQQLDDFVEIMSKILQEIKEDPQLLRQAPLKQVVGRLDEVKAAKELDVCWKLKVKESVDRPSYLS